MFPAGGLERIAKVDLGPPSVARQFAIVMQQVSSRQYNPVHLYRILYTTLRIGVGGRNTQVSTPSITVERARLCMGMKM